MQMNSIFKYFVLLLAMQKHILSCCFIGHRKIERTKELEHKIFKFVEYLIVNKNVNVFLFGSRSEFNNLCYEIVSILREKYPSINRIYVRGEYQYIYDEYKDFYFVKGYESSYLPNKCKIGSRASYIERNFEMIDKSDYCIFYYDKNYFLKNGSTSGTKLAFDYSIRKNKKVFNLY